MALKIRLGVLALASQLAASLLVLHWLHAFSIQIPGSEEALASSIALLSPSILLGWLALGAWIGIPLLIASSALCLLSAASTELYRYNMLLLVFLGASTAGQFLRARLQEMIRRQETTVETLSEEANSLQAGLSKLQVLRDGFQQRAAQIGQLKEALAAFSKSLPLPEIGKTVVDKTIEIVARPASCLFFLVDEVEQGLSLLASHVEVPTQRVKSKRGDPFDQWVFKQRKALLVEDLRKDFRFGLSPQDLDRPFLSVAAAPLIHEQKIIGVLRLDASAPQAFAADDLRLLGILADLAAVCVKNGSLYARTQELAIRDGLTGLFVHRHFRERFAEELSRCRRAGEKLSLLFLDIDHFKSYNDRFGHSAGDIVLKEVARGLHSLPGTEGLCARIGGEEFAALLPRVGVAKALEVAESFRRRIEDQVFILRRQVSQVTVSIGIATFPESGQDPEELLRKADRCLYQAKQAGRNRVCQASSF